MFPLARGALAPLAPGGRPVIWAATGRSGGISTPPYDTLNLADHVGDAPEAVASNRWTLADNVAGTRAQIAVMAAAHGAQVAHVRAGGIYPGVDALVTSTPDVVLIAQGADCVPLALIGDDDATVAAVHCGWRGLVVDVVAHAVTELRRRGVGVRLAVLGPAICGSCYPVPSERAEQVRAALSSQVAAVGLVTTPGGQPGIDVRAALSVRLPEIGVPAAEVIHVGGCTFEDPGLFSFRRDKVTGRQGVAVVSSGG